MARPERKNAGIVDLSKVRAKKINFDRSHFGKKFKRPPVSLKLKIAILNRDKLRCVQCKTRLKIRTLTKKTLFMKGGTFHHIVPLIYGGPNIVENICLLCTACHNKVHSGRETPNKYYDMLECYIVSGKLWCGNG